MSTSCEEKFENEVPKQKNIKIGILKGRPFYLHTNRWGISGNHEISIFTFSPDRPCYYKECLKDKIVLHTQQVCYDLSKTDTLMIFSHEKFDVPNTILFKDVMVSRGTMKQKKNYKEMKCVAY